MLAGFTHSSSGYFVVFHNKNLHLADLAHLRTEVCVMGHSESNTVTVA